MQDYGKYIISGGGAALISSVVFQPFDVLRTSIILQKTTLRSAVLLIYKGEGLQGFWRGGKAAAVRTSLGGAIFWVTLESLRDNYYKGLECKSEFKTDSVHSGLSRGIAATLVAPLSIIK